MAEETTVPAPVWPPVERPLPKSPTNYERLVNQSIYEHNRPSLYDSIIDTTLSSDVGRFIGSRSILGSAGYDPNWIDDNSSELDLMLASTPFEFHDDILSSRTMNDAVYTKMRIDERMKYMQRVGDAGVVGAAAVLGINLFEGAALGAATFPMTAPLLAGTGYRGFRTAKAFSQVLGVAKASNRAVAAGELARTSSRIGLFARGVGVGSAEALAYTFIDSLVDPTVEGHDFRYAALFGGSFGGAFNGLAGKSLLAAELARAGRKFELDMLSRGYQLPARFGADDAVMRFAEAANVDTELSSAVFALMRNLGIDPDTIAVGGRAARSKVKDTIKFPKSRGVEIGGADILEDGRIILRSFYSDTPNPEAAFRGLALVIRRRLFNSDLPETSRGGITDDEVRAIDEWLGVRRGERIFRQAERGPGGTVSGAFIKETTAEGPRRLVRTTKWTSEDETKFANGFFRWLMSDGAEKETLSDDVIAVFEKVRLFLAKTYDDLSDPRILSGKKPTSKITNILERALEREILNKRIADNEFENAMLRAISGGETGATAADAMNIPDLPATGTRSDWSDAPTTDGVVSVGSRMLNQSIAAMKSPLGVVRWLGFHMHNSRVAPKSGAGGRIINQPTTFNEYMRRIKSVSEARFLRTYNRALNQYRVGGKDLKDIGPAERIRGLFQHEKRAQFDRMVYEEVHAPGTHSDPNVKLAADALRKEFKMFVDLAKKAKVAGFADLADDPNYFPRLYRWDKLDAFVLKYGEPELKKVIYNALDRTELGEEEADALATLLARRLSGLSRGERKDTIFDLDAQVLEILSQMEKPKRPGGVILTPRVRHRFRADMLTRMEDGSQASLSSFVETDIPTAFGAYSRSVSGAIAETKLIQRFKAEVAARDGEEIAEKIDRWEDVIQYVREKSRGKMTEEQLSAELGSLSELRAGLRSEPDPVLFGGDNTFNAIFSENARRLMKISYLQNGSYFGLAQLNELARTVNRAGLRAVLQQLPVIPELLRAARSGRPKNEIMELMEQTFGLGSDRIRRTTGRIDNAINSYPPNVRSEMWQRFSAKMAKFDRNLDALSFAFADLTGLAPFTSATQHLTAASLIQRLHRIGLGKDKDFGSVIVRQWGVSDAEYKRIIKAINEFGEVDSRGRVIALNEERWNTDTFRSFLTFVERGTMATIQDPPVRGDFHKFFFTPMGKLLIQFKTFNLKAVDAFLRANGQRLSNGESGAVLREYFATMAVGMMTQVFRKELQYAAVRGEKQRKKFAEENFSPSAVASYAVSGASENFLLIGATESIANFAFGTTVFGDRIRYSGLASNPLDISATPAWQVVSRTFSGIRGPVRAALNSDYEFSQKDVHNIRMAIPGARMFGIAQGIAWMESLAGVENLPEESKKR